MWLSRVFILWIVEHIKSEAINSRCSSLGQGHCLLVCREFWRLIGLEEGCVLYLPNTAQVGIFTSSLVSLALGMNAMNVHSLAAFSPLLPCGSHVALLNYTRMSQQGLWKEGDALPVGKMGGDKWKKQGLNEMLRQIGIPCTHSNIRCLIILR